MSTDLDAKDSTSGSVDVSPDVYHPAKVQVDHHDAPLPTKYRYSLKAAVNDLSDNRRIYAMAASAAFGGSWASLIRVAEV
jgi:hypothetical protein